MGFHFQRRISLGKGLGLSVSRSGVSASQRTRWGSFGTGGFSLKSGIPGLSFRKRYRKKDAIVNITAYLLAAVVMGIVWLLFVCLQVCVVALVLVASLVWEVAKWLVLTAGDFAHYVRTRPRE